MGRSRLAPIKQPDEVSCGPTALKMALHILGKRRSLPYLSDLCNTTQNGTSTKDMITAIRKLGYPVLSMEKATLRHLQSALRAKANKKRAVLVSYIYDRDKNGRLDLDSEHWAVVSSYAASKARIIILDSYTGQRKSYSWEDFRERWKGTELKRRYRAKRGKAYEMIQKSEKHLMVVLAEKEEHLPQFSVNSCIRMLPMKTPIRV